MARDARALVPPGGDPASIARIRTDQRISGHLREVMGDAVALHAQRAGAAARG
jgi:glutamine amidotransferase PdxT